MALASRTPSPSLWGWARGLSRRRQKLKMLAAAKMMPDPREIPQWRPPRQSIKAYTCDEVPKTVIDGEKSPSGDNDTIMEIMNILIWLNLLEYGTNWTDITGDDLLRGLQKGESTRRVLSALRDVRSGNVGACPNRL
ncbi:hypothetical protein DL766_001023 [Monosporascus sp. MC13-8B]|uniref:Uncharacterized protein n=1 Tax=Monosporascus cannonballus TaxID=155416 RepID=A0ABY0HB56_9PEZI|nr:hypothetical protein DL763_010667 [Monosporascus cannonballus]RYO86366.1 hypothetical protein DL762_004782 [Monosporascus cannonballus]RYP38314.1 hypothetical protein DL766_001023 [Monosporascus sp. MC13-8B]